MKGWLTLFALLAVGALAYIFLSGLSLAIGAVAKWVGW